MRHGNGRLMTTIGALWLAFPLACQAAEDRKEFAFGIVDRTRMP
jgi:hypothetical protein